MHRFVSSGNPHKSLCAVRALFGVSTIANSNVTAAQFATIFDVTDGYLPFLIWFPSLLAMGAMLDYRYNNLSLSIKKTCTLSTQRKTHHIYAFRYNAKAVFNEVR